VFANSDLPRHVRVGVANQRTVMRMLEVPPLSDAKDLDTAVRFQAEDQVPMPLSNAVLDYRALGIVDTPAGARQRVLLVAAQRDMVEKLLGAVRAAGLHPEGIDLSAFALIRSLHSSIGATDSLAPGEARPPVLHLNVGGLTNMAIAEDTDCRFTRVLARGLEAIAADVAERRGVPVDQARELLRRIDLAPSTSARDELGPAGIESSSAAGLGGAHGPTVAGPAAELRTSSEPNGDGSMQAAAAPSMAVADEDTVTGPRSQTAGNGDGVAESQADQPGPSADQPGPAADQPGPAADQPGPSAIGGQPPESRIAGADADPQSATAEAAGPASRRRPPVDEFADVRPILESGVRGIASEVRNSLDFYQAQEHGPTVSMVLLSGPALDIPGFAAMLELNLGVRVHAESVAAADDSVLNGISVQYLAIAAGLAVEDVAS
jgi:Tfp pilus assembly PilM family ATPase